jgi:hypothetical protein
MTQKIQFDTARYCRSNAGRMGQWRGQDVAGLVAGEVARLKAELAALKDAAKNIVAKWNSYDFSAEQCLDELARLCGEE